MRVAALYDIHGNLPALEAVLADPRLAGADVIVSDVEEAAAAIRASGYPDAGDHASQLLDPPSADEVSAYFESLRGA